MSLLIHYNLPLKAEWYTYHQCEAGSPTSSPAGSLGRGTIYLKLVSRPPTLVRISLLGKKSFCQMNKLKCMHSYIFQSLIMVLIETK